MVSSFEGIRVEWAAEFQQFAVLHTLKLFSKWFVESIDFP